MYTEGFEQWLKTANKNFGAPIADMQKANTEIWRHLMSDHLEMVSDNLSRLSDQLKRLAHVKRPEDYLNVMRECINEDINASIENSQHLLHSTLEHFEHFARTYGSVQESTLKQAHKEREREK